VVGRDETIVTTGTMISIACGLGVFGLLSITALTALYLHPRLPDHQLSKETQDG
jgi:hypothetical protein